MIIILALLVIGSFALLGLIIARGPCSMQNDYDKCLKEILDEEITNPMDYKQKTRNMVKAAETARTKQYQQEIYELIEFISFDKSPEFKSKMKELKDAVDNLCIAYSEKIQELNNE